MVLDHLFDLYYIELAKFQSANEQPTICFNISAGIALKIIGPLLLPVIYRIMINTARQNNMSVTSNSISHCRSKDQSISQDESSAEVAISLAVNGKVKASLSVE
jgi:hypothetical protein